MAGIASADAVELVEGIADGAATVDDRCRAAGRASRRCGPATRDGATVVAREATETQNRASTPDIAGFS
jgi:hypothetical protein